MGAPGDWSWCKNVIFQIVGKSLLFFTKRQRPYSSFQGPFQKNSCNLPMFWTPIFFRAHFLKIGLTALWNISWSQFAENRPASLVRISSCSKSAENRFLVGKKNDLFWDFFFGRTSVGGFGVGQLLKIAWKSSYGREKKWFFPTFFLARTSAVKIGENRSGVSWASEVAQNRLKIDFWTEKKSIFSDFFFSGGRRPAEKNVDETSSPPCFRAPPRVFENFRPT